jgi:D-alanyl-lipoteichoic acid acyltransferase DltB (MBOAT superfamily)
LTFDLITIFILALLALAYGAFLPSRLRGWALFAGSILALYRFQPPLPIRYSDYILPTFTILLTILCWWLTRKSGDPLQTSTIREDINALSAIAILVAALSFMRFVDETFRITASRPPDPFFVLLSLGIMIGLGFLGSRLTLRIQRRWLSVTVIFIVVLFVVLKADPLAAVVSRIWRGLSGQDTSLASIVDLNWLGFSYIAFRLIHTLRDRQTGQLPALSLREYVTYVVFFPALTAGPIDRAERFVKDFRALPGQIGLNPMRWQTGLTRIFAGLLKKFVIADTLAQGLALTPASALQAHSSLALWALLYGYALRLFFDFSGYSDIAIGIGILFGIQLPENFNRPYLQASITAFWQSWHITLSNWARFYVFSPLSRALLTRKPKPSPTLVVFVCQMATMVIIGLWHGITLNFLIWGVWHGAGLFIHKQWSDRTRVWYRGLNEYPRRKRAWTIFAWFITMQFVVIGWVWFALPDVNTALHVLGGLVGLGLK